MTLIRNVVEGIPALDKGRTRWPLRLFQLLSFYDTLKFLRRKPAGEGLGCESQACNCWKITLKSNHINFTLNFKSIELTMFCLTFGPWGVRGRTGRLLPHKMQKTMKIASTVQIFKKIVLMKRIGNHWHIQAFKIFLGRFASSTHGAFWHFNGTLSK